MIKPFVTENYLNNAPVHPGERPDYLDHEYHSVKKILREDDITDYEIEVRVMMYDSFGPTEIMWDFEVVGIIGEGYKIDSAEYTTNEFEEYVLVPGVTFKREMPTE